MSVQLPSLASLDPNALVAVPSPMAVSTTPPGSPTGVGAMRTESNKAALRSCPYPKQKWHNDSKKTPWTEESKEVIRKAVDAGILRFATVSSPNGVDDGDAFGVEARFHAWEFRTLDANVDYDDTKERRAFYCELQPGGGKKYVEHAVSYPKSLLYEAKDALKAHKGPSFFYHANKDRTGGVWFFNDVELPEWLQAAITARALRKDAERAEELEKAKASEAARKARLAEIEERERARERERIATLEAAAAKAARRQALITQLRQTGEASADDRQWFLETFDEELRAAVDKIVLTEHADRLKAEFARIPASSIANAPSLVDARLVRLERYLLDVILSTVERIIEAFKLNDLDPVSDATAYTAKARTRLVLPQVGECVTLYVRTQPSRAAKGDSSKNEAAAIAWSLLFDRNSAVRNAVNEELLEHGYQKAELKGNEQIQITSVNTLRGALNGLWKHVFTEATKDRAALWDLPERVNEAGANPVFAARLPTVDLSDVRGIE